MSSVKIQGSATGTANFTIAVPDGTSTDRTIELPDAAGSFVLADGSNNVTVSGDLTVDTDTLHVDSTNNLVGVGTASPAGKTTINSANNALTGLSTASNYHLNLHNPENDTGEAVGISFSLSTGHDVGASIYHERVGGSSQGDLVFATRPSGGSVTERARIDSSGNLLIGGTSTANAYVSLRGGDNNCIQTFRIGTGTRSHLVFYNGTSGSGTVVGSIQTSGSSTSYNTSSDYRLKENVADLTGAIDRVKQVPVHRFNFIVDPDKTVDGFLAHEVADVVPEAITGAKDEVDEDGNPVYQGIDQSKLVPLLTAAIKEQQALIEDLQTRLAALENA